ncbi:endonuclease/exonuclease/phosphatase family protein [Candidatus Saccharibacteria bacterium]|nr:endonuclease/exonuclease/phosphatase family protein [Candidatus Saccharibacteria bacterium]
MKLIQINTWQGRIAPKLLQFIEHEKPDLICTQEIFDSEHDTPAPDGQFNLGKEIRKVSGLEHTWFSPRLSVDIAGEEIPQGNMIFSRWPLLDQRTILIRGKPIWHATRKDPDRNVSVNLQIVKLKINDQEMILANHHGYVARNTGERFGDKVSLRSMSKVAKELRKFADYPLILSGDMNVISKTSTMRVFRNFLRDLTAENHIENTLSPIHRFNKPVACDHILVNDKILVKNFAVRDQELVSDHLPLVLDFEIK